MCMSSPKVPETKITPPVQELEMDATNNTVAARESDLKRRKRALSRLSTMEGGSMQASGNGKTRLGS